MVSQGSCFSVAFVDANSVQDWKNTLSLKNSLNAIVVVVVMCLLFLQWTWTTYAGADMLL